MNVCFYLLNCLQYTAGWKLLEITSIPTKVSHLMRYNILLLEQAPFLDDIRDVGTYDVAVLGVPFDGGTTYRPGTRFGPQGIRRISALCKFYFFPMLVRQACAYFLGALLKHRQPHCLFVFLHYGKPSQLKPQC